MISMSEELLSRVDREVGMRGTTRSAFLQAAAQRELGWPDAQAVELALERGRAAIAGLGPFESAAVIRSERDARDGHDRHTG